MLHPNCKTWKTTIRSYCFDAGRVESLSLFVQNLGSLFGREPNHRVLGPILKACSALSAISLGKALHGYVVKQGHFSCQAVSKAVLNMYAKCGKLDDCKQMFDQMGYYDTVIWNIILSGFSGSRMHNDEVMNLFYAMYTVGDTKPNPITVAIILPVCARLGFIDAGKCIHSYVIKSGLETNNLVGNSLVSMYAKCGLVYYDAYTAFNSISHKDAVSWNAIIAGFAENRFINDAFNLFGRMLKGPIKPNYATIATILPVCASLDESFAYRCGREIHCYVIHRNELEADVSVCNSLVSFYLRLGHTEQAESLFERMNSRDLVSWNAIIAGYTSNSEWLKALDLFHRLLSVDKIMPDSVTILSILPACGCLQNLLVGKSIHGYIFRHPSLSEDVAVGNAMISFYAKCNNVEAASKTFFTMSRTDLISWNSMLDAFAESGYNAEFLNLLVRMFAEGLRPDSVTMLIIIHFCATFLTVHKVKETQGYSIRAGYLLGDIVPTIGNALLDAYAKFGDMEYAYKIFQTLSDKKNLVTCNSMISGYVNCGAYDGARILFNKMFETDLTTWNLLVRVYAENDCPDQALDFFQQLKAQGLKPDAVTIMSLLPVCSQMASVNLLKQCHGYVVRACLDDIHLKGALLDVYAKCGAIACAYKLFQSSPYKDLVMFTAMVGGFAMHGMGKQALRVFAHMLEMGMKPDHVIITAALSACSHGGLVNEGLEIFYSIEEAHGMNPTMEQYACVVDLLARGGQVDDAFSFVTRMPIKPNPNIWGTLLGACRTYHKVELGCLVADHLFEVEADNIGNYVVMSNLYAAGARWDQVAEVRRLMKTRDLKKPAGCSWIEVEREKNTFIAGDSSHPKRGIIYSILSTLDQQIKEPVQL
ncbi:putative pentatricopeptide repeat-containing protein At5g08490 [Ziziphus jujuba]|uniref:Pentatricopeptide repeat-containing protein At5g08490 n=1 Tax=Ziziphus jujuba TaxID=326968 RepID=A0ABM3I197_ZIZJJ|nr:putative pentatricopeptide repeat-containing protein At5g08490 [Ziziphus jujuba]XP_048318545.2 putative pentatricopeptide repeat-containing protein At5g08490 [Ziziphus jujuba]XP_060669456.1 putative pentatricopeptide repeat-containing protein At5g08490 [Ziziphus jujuba]XP_060669457.1 putative pentatricopeptide repeat-containing protein At5g08490 [Ziziphus jujuba]XP_060669458.1 putative pentatricopeptide repeat-containing protein At5g08490 [Ziziphus jujuba]